MTKGIWHCRFDSYETAGGYRNWIVHNFSIMWRNSKYVIYSKEEVGLWQSISKDCQNEFVPQAPLRQNIKSVSDGLCAWARCVHFLQTTLFCWFSRRTNWSCSGCRAGLDPHKLNWILDILNSRARKRLACDKVFSKTVKRNLCLRLRWDRTFGQCQNWPLLQHEHHFANNSFPQIFLQNKLN